MKKTFLFLIINALFALLFAQNNIYPSMLQTEIDKLQNVSEGTVVLNKTTNCLNYYSQKQWLALCGNCAVIPPTIDTIIIKDNNAILYLKHPEKGIIFNVKLNANTNIRDSIDVIVLKDLEYGVSYNLGISAEKSCGTSPITNKTIKCDLNDACKGQTTLLDSRNNKTYPIKSIDGMCWMLADLVVEDKQNVNSAAEVKLGKEINHYTWQYANNVKALPAYNPTHPTNQGICPAGWHLPTSAEIWQIYLYVTALNLNPMNPSINEAYSFAEKKYVPTEYGIYWTGSIAESGMPNFFLANKQLIRLYETKENIGASVRCIKDF